MRFKRSKRLILILAIIILIPVITVILIIYTNPFRSTHNKLTITVAWNPRSTADDITRVIAGEINTSVVLQNITGAGGANGANEVLRLPRNGGNILSTSLTSFVTSEAMGFAESSHRDWEVWLFAFSPAILVVPNDSHFKTFENLIETIREYPGIVRCADDGYGTVSYIAAELFSSQVALEIFHQSFSGSSSATIALEEYQADFAIIPSSQAKELLRSGTLRALGVFSESTFILSGGIDIIIPPIAGFSNNFDSSLPFGEYFGLFIPESTPSTIINSYDNMFMDVIGSDAFIEFARNSGLEIITPDRVLSNEIAEHICSVANWTLYNTGFLPVNPETLDIPKP